MHDVMAVNLAYKILEVNFSLQAEVYSCPAHCMVQISCLDLLPHSFMVLCDLQVHSRAPQGGQTNYQG